MARKAVPKVENSAPTQVENLEGISLEKAQEIANNIPNLDDPKDQLAAQMAKNATDTAKPRRVSANAFQVNKEVEVDEEPQQKVNEDKKEDDTMKTITMDEMFAGLKGMSKEERKKLFDAVDKADDEQAEETKEEEEEGLSTAQKVAIGIGVTAAAAAAVYEYCKKDKAPDVAAISETGQDIAAFMFA